VRESRSRSPDQKCIDHNDPHTSGVEMVMQSTISKLCSVWPEREREITSKGMFYAKSFETRYKTTGRNLVSNKTFKH
jgi:hypothetical protein